MINLKIMTSLLGFVVLVLCGCTIHHEPKTRSVRSRLIPNFSINGPVKVISGQQRRQKTLDIDPYNVVVDYGQVGEIAKKMLESELDNRRSSSSDLDPKTLTIGISDIRITGAFQCNIYFYIEGGDGYKKGHKAMGQSWNYQKAIDCAIADIAVRILNDEHILSYLES